MSPDSLGTYREKRRPGRSPEPFGGARGTGAGLFCVQKHAARRAGPHHDLRLEFGGVLLSWAVPKGISPDPADKRYAHRTEDHPVEYCDFEGVIPEGEYGAGEMIVWDLGRWIALEDPEAGLEAGKLLFELRGYKLRGVWTLVRLKKGESGRDWLLIRERRGGHPILQPAALPEASVLSGLTVEALREVAAGHDPGEPLRRKLEDAGARVHRLQPEEIGLMLAKAADEPFDDPAWWFELKLDGYRMLAVGGREGRGGRAEAALRTRNGHDATASFPEIARSLGKLPFDHVVLDGEVVVHDPAGLPSFQALQRRARLSRPPDILRASVEAPASFYAFDLLGFDGFDLRRLPLRERKSVLADLLPPAGPLRFCEHFEGTGRALYRHVQALRLEGIMAKRADSPYTKGRSPAWLKIHAAHEAPFVIVGFTHPGGSRTGFGALHLAAMTAGEEGDEPVLRYAGRVGTGFDETALETIRARLDPLVRSEPAFEDPVPGGGGHVWVEPRLVARVRYKEITDDRLLRQPVFLELEDVPPEECLWPRGPREGLDEPVPVETGPPPPDAIPLTNLAKVFWPDSGTTKGDLIGYYRAIAPWLLPYLRDRPLVLTRYPDGIEGKSFFQKNAPGFAPEWLRTERIYSEGSERDIDYFIARDVASLVYLANLGTIPLHVWASRIGSLDRPDWCLLDLDPKHRTAGEEVYAPFDDVIEVARAIHRLCRSIGLPSYPKTSGSSGIHVLIPLGGQLDYEQSRTLARLLAQRVVAECPGIATLTRNPSGRDGRIYVDTVQNGWGRLVVAPYSVRPRPGAPVSAPLRWREVKRGLAMERFTIATMPRRARALSEDPMLPVLTEEPDLVGALQKLHDLLEGGDPP